VTIYGPFEAGFSSSNPGVSCLGNNKVDGGVDTAVADAIISHLCKKSISVLDYCGGHATPFHYHQSMHCLYNSSKTLPGHSTKIGIIPFIILYYIILHFLDRVILLTCRNRSRQKSDLRKVYISKRHRCSANRPGCLRRPRRQDTRQS
jgi:hypothetical protein